MNGAFQVFFEGWIFIVLALCAVGVIALLVGALWMYQDAQRRRMDATLWLIFLIIATLLGTVVGFVIVVVLYLIIRHSHPIGGGVLVSDRPGERHVEDDRREDDAEAHDGQRRDLEGLLVLLIEVTDQTCRRVEARVLVARHAVRSRCIAGLKRFLLSMAILRRIRRSLIRVARMTRASFRARFHGRGRRRVHRQEAHDELRPRRGDALQ